MPEAGAFMAGAIVSKLLMDKSGWDQSIRSVKKDEESLTGAAGRIGRGFQKTGAIMAVAGAAIAGSIVLMIKKTAAQGEAFYDLSQKTGISAKMLSSYKLAADTTGASIEDLGVGLRIMAKNAVHAATEGGNFKEKFDRMGISVTDVHGRIRPMNDLLLDLADRFSKMPDGTIKTAMAMEIFGRSGTNLIPMLNLGRKGLQENAEMAQRLGLVYTDKAAKASDDFMDRTTELKESFRGLTKEIAIGAMPVMTKFIAMIRDGVASITAWVQKHGGLTSSLLTTTAAAGAFTAVLGTGIMILGSLIVKLGILAVALKTTVGALAISTAIFTAGAAAVAVYAVKLWELQKAKDKLRDADYELFEAEMDLGKKLREAADAAGMTRREFVQLTEKYHGNIRALAWAIMKGKESKEIQEALAKVGKKHAETIEEQKKKMEAARLAAAGLGSEFMNLGKKTETLAEKLNLLTFAKINKQIQDNRKALREYAGQLPVAEVARLIKENEELEDSLNPIPGLLKRFGEAAQDAADGGLMSLSAMLRTTDTDADNWNRSWQAMTDDLEASFKEIAEKNKKAQKEQTKTTEAETERQAHLFDGLYNDIAMGLSDTIEKIIDGTEKFGSFFKGFLTTIKKSFARVLAEMVSDYVVKFIKLIIEKRKSVV